jgi:hypothetical protein
MCHVIRTADRKVLFCFIRNQPTLAKEREDFNFVFIAITGIFKSCKFFIYAHWIRYIGIGPHCRRSMFETLKDPFRVISARLWDRIRSVRTGLTVLKNNQDSS